MPSDPFQAPPAVKRLPGLPEGVVHHLVTRVGGLVLALPLVTWEIGRGARNLLLGRPEAVEFGSAGSTDGAAGATARQGR